MAAEYEARPDDDLHNHRVRRAYSELAKDVVRRFKALPTKVEVLTVSTERSPGRMSASLSPPAGARTGRRPRHARAAAG